MLDITKFRTFAHNFKLIKLNIRILDGNIRKNQK